MRDFTLVDNGHGFEASVRVDTDASRLLARTEIGRARVVEQEERAEPFAMALIGKHRAHREAVAHPVWTWCAVDTEDSLHCNLQFRGDAAQLQEE